MGKKKLTYEAMALFGGIDESKIKRIIDVALSRRGDYADLFFEHTITKSFSLRDGEVNNVSSDIEYGVGIRVLSGDRTGYAYVESTEEKDLIKAAKTAAEISDGSPSGTIRVMEVKPLIKNYYPVKEEELKAVLSGSKGTGLLKGIDFTKEVIKYIQELNQKIFSADTRVNKVLVKYNNISSTVLIANSEGRIVSDYRPLSSLSAVCIMQEGNRFENGRSSRSFRKGVDFLSENLINEIAREVINQTSLMFIASKPKGGEMPVVLGAGGSGILLHEAIGHSFEADFNRKGVSIFSDKLGKKVCSEFVNVIDDGTVPYNRGAVNVDDEGEYGQKTYIVKDGILNSYLHDKISAGYYNVAPTGNGRRESFRSIPIPRMRATYMENGQLPEKEIVSSVKKGIFVDNFTNGQVQIGAGDFTFFVKTGYLIENGRLTQPVRDINIIGNGPRALADITMVSDNLEIDNGTWTCGKDGQSCPVTCGMPSVLVKSLIVGGES